MADNIHPFLTLYCSHCGTEWKVQIGCGDRACPHCRKKWFGYHYKTLLDLVQGWNSVYFLTLTLKTIPDKRFGRYDVARIRKDFSRLRSRFKQIKGGFYVVQVTSKEEGWHLHIHALFDGSYIPHGLLVKAWKEITGGSYIVGIERVREPRRAVHYLIGDFLQRPRIRAEDVDTFNSVFKGSRLVQPFGVYRKVRFRVPFPCPNCGRCEWVTIEKLLGEKWSWRPAYEDSS